MALLLDKPIVSEDAKPNLLNIIYSLTFLKHAQNT